MIASALVQPLVQPLTASSFSRSARRCSQISGSRLVMTALAVSALMAAATPSDAATDAEQVEATTYTRSAHKKPTRIVVKPMWATQAFALRQIREELEAPQEAASFENDTLSARWHRHRVQPGIVHGSGLVHGRRLDRLIGAADLAFLNFGSARVLAAQPHS